MNRTVEFTKDDLLRIVYFVLCKYNLDALHMQGTSSKRDMLGGFLDRWINRASEFVVFNHLLSQKPYKVSSDFFLYGNDSDKNAPDILGLIDTEQKPIVKFSEYRDGTWAHIPDMPFIEVKNLRKDQYLCGVRDTQMADDRYYAFVETDLREDYLSIIFEDSLFREENLSMIKMDKGFIASDIDNQIMHPIQINKPQTIGTFRLLGIYSGQDLKKFSKKLCPKESVIYFQRAESPDFSSSRSDVSILIPAGKSIYNKNPDLLDFYLNFDHQGEILRINKGSIYLKCYGQPNSINEYPLPLGISKLILANFERSSGWSEYTAYKSVFDNTKNSFMNDRPQDRTEEVLNIFDMFFTAAKP